MKSIKTKILSLTAIALVAAGGLCLQNVETVSANTETTPASFAMVDGASIRVPTADEATGIRFRSLLTKTQKTAYENEGYTISAGTFILPSIYYEANPLTATNVTTDYCWDSAEQGKTQILNVQGALYEDASISENHWVLNGSVLNIQDANFMLDYMGVGYLKLEKDGATTYVLAETKVDNARTPVEVAELAIAANDPNKDTLATNYVNKYVEVYQAANDGALPTVSYTENVNLQTKDGYVKSDELSGAKEAEFSGYGATVAPSTVKTGDYIYNATAAKTALTLTQENVVNYNYDYVGNKFKILDFEGETLTEQYNGGTYYNGKAATATIQDFSADGLHSLNSGSSAEGAWDGVKGMNVSFPTPVNKITMMVKAVGGATLNPWWKITKADGTTADIYLTKTTVEASPDWQKVTFDLATPIIGVQLVSFEIYIDVTPFSVDAIYGEAAQFVAEKLEEISYEGTTAEISFNAPTKAYGEGLFEEDLASVTYKVEYKATTEETYNELTAEAGNYTFTAANAQYYDVKVTATCGDKIDVQEFVVKPTASWHLLTDFEEGIVVDSTDTYVNSIGDAEQLDSGKVFKGNMQGGWVRFKFSEAPSFLAPCKKFKFTMYSAVGCTLTIQIGNKTKTFDLVSGTNECEVEFDDSMNDLTGYVWFGLGSARSDIVFEIDNFYAFY